MEDEVDSIFPSLSSGFSYQPKYFKPYTSNNNEISSLNLTGGKKSDNVSRLISGEKGADNNS